MPSVTRPLSQEAEAIVRQAVKLLRERGVKDDYCIRCGTNEWNADLVAIPAASLLGTLGGLLSVFASVNWGTIWQQDQRRPFLIFSALLLAGASGSGTGWWIYQRRLTRTRKNSSYSRLKNRISGYFRNPAM